jgi:2-methylisocitrate lyase-like PEP mutase family enzyme
MKKTTKLKELFNREEIFVAAGGCTALHARMAQLAGFECAYMSGGGVAAMIHGMPDAGLLTATEMVANAERMANCVSIPLISDADTGFGNAVNVRRTVQEFVRAGVAGIHMEDQVSPKRCGGVKGKEVIPIEEAVGKYRAAVDAKNEIDPDFVIISRTDARGAAGGSVEEVIKRLKAYKAAGVDVVYAEALQSREEVKAVRAAVDGPMVGTLGYIKPQPTLAEMQSLGYAAAMYATMMQFCALEAIWDYLNEFKAQGDQAVPHWKLGKTSKYPMPHPFDLVDFAKVAECEQKYLSADALKKYEGSIGNYDPRAAKATGSGDTSEK